MNNYARKAAVSLFAGAALATGALAPASAAGPIFTGGLVNVTIVDAVDVNNNDILNGVTVAAAAAICGVSVNVLAADLGPDGIVEDCNASNDITTTVTQRRGR